MVEISLTVPIFSLYFYNQYSIFLNLNFEKSKKIIEKTMLILYTINGIYRSEYIIDSI